MKIELRNYRCFTFKEPCVIDFEQGFTSYIGANNSGKSTILRALFELRQLFGELVAPQSFIQGNWERGAAFPGGVDPFELVNDMEGDEFAIDIQVPYQPCELVPNSPVATRLKLAFRPTGNMYAVTAIFATEPDGNVVELAIQRNAGLTSPRQNIWQVQGWPTAVDFSQIIQIADIARRARYYGPYRNPINEGAGNHFDIPVGTALVGAWSSWKAGSSKQQKTAIGRVEEDVRRILGLRSLQVNASADAKSLTTVLDGRPYKLEELGAGVAELIMVFAASLIQKPSIVAIDEPESHLHPALQSEFLTTLGGYTERGVIFATHSLGLARGVSDRIYALHQEKTKRVLRPYEDVPNPIEFLGSLGFAGMRELGFTKLLLVEGTTEVRTIQQFLRKLRKDHEFILFPLGGGQLINSKYAHELAELRRLPAESICVLIDSERSAPDAPIETERQAFLDFCAGLGFKTHATQLRATENYFPDRAVKSAMGKDSSALTPYQSLKSAGRPWPKSQNWRIASEMTEDELLNTDIGAFITEL